MKWPVIGAREHPQTHSTSCFPAQNAGRTGTIVRDRLKIHDSSDCLNLRLTGCHIPPLVDQELTALIRATNDNDVDNGLSSWIGRCCKRKRRTQAMLEVRIFDRILRGMASPISSVVEIPQPLPRSLFVSADLPADAVHRGSAAPLHGPDSKQTVATPPSDGCVNGDDSFHESVVCAQTTSAQPALRHAGTCTSSALMLPDTVLPHSTPSSARFALPSFNNQPASFAAHESSMVLLISFLSTYAHIDHASFRDARRGAVRSTGWVHPCSSPLPIVQAPNFPWRC